MHQNKTTINLTIPTGCDKLDDIQQRNVDDHSNVILQAQDEYNRLVKGMSKSPK